MTVHVISVGRSILDSLAEPSRAFKAQTDLAGDVRQRTPQELLRSRTADEASDWLARALTPDRDPDKALALAELAAAVHPELWPADISAETATFSRLPDARRVLPATDIAILVCSDTSAGLVAGLWNAAALTGSNLERVKYLASPLTNAGQVRGKAVIARVAGMDAASSKKFGEAMAGLGTLGRNLLSGDVGTDERFCFYLSGGFKAAIPYLIALAEGVRSLNPERPVKAYVLHDTAPEDTPLIELPLRYLIADQISYELSDYGQDGIRKSVPDPSMLHGYAYEIERGKCKLTPFGKGLRALFGLNTPGLG